MTVNGAEGAWSHQLVKPDGRALWLYGRAPFPPPPQAVGALPEPRPSPHLRWHPLRGEWIVYAGHRQLRPFLPAAARDPLAPSDDPQHPTELPVGEYDVAVFENRYPTLRGRPDGGATPVAEGAPAEGVCEVVVFTQETDTSLGALPLEQVELIVWVWGERTRLLGARDDVAYVMPFENRGAEVGVTLSHPHGQIYAYPFVPPLPALATALAAGHLAETGKNLLVEMVENERADGARLVADAGQAAAFVPKFARYAYEVWIVPTEPAPRIYDLSPSARRAFALALKTTLQKLDGLFGVPMPYVLVVHQAPTDGAAHAETQAHIEIYPALRMKGRLKYLAGSELGAGTFTADTLPEEKAAELRAVSVPP